MRSHPTPSALLNICRTPPVCVPRSATVREAIAVMVKIGVGAVAVVEDDVLVGIFTERDLMAKVADRELDPSEVDIADVMETDVRTITPDASRSQAASLMLTHHCRHLPITNDEGQLLGMLSIRHLYRDQLQRMKGQMDSLESYITADGPGG